MRLAVYGNVIHDTIVHVDGPVHLGNSHSCRTSRRVGGLANTCRAAIRLVDEVVAVTSVGDDFLKDQIGQKDTQITELNDQLKRRDEQIMTMLERDRGTNYLINGLQQALSQSLGIESPDRLRIRREGDNRPGTPPPPRV